MDTKTCFKNRICWVKKKKIDMKNNETKNKSSQKLQIQEIEWKER